LRLSTKPAADTLDGLSSGQPDWRKRWLWPRVVRHSSEGVSAVQINVSTRHGHLSDATRAKITAKVEKLARLFERLTAIDVTVDLEHAESPIVEILVSAEHKHDFVSNDTAEGLMAALDGAVHKIEQQLRKYKEKVVERHRGTATKEQLSSGPVGDE
jgi:putative sigma-54 modulation protein